MAAEAGPSQFNPPTGTMPGYDAFVITPNSGANLATPVRALWVGAAGDICLVTMKGTSLTFTGVNAGSILPIQCIRVNATTSGTTAGGIIGII